MKSPSNFERLVLGCMDSYDSNQVVILQHFSRSTRFAILCTFGIEVEKTPENHLVDPNEKSKQLSTSTYKHTSTMKRKETPKTLPKSAKAKSAETEGIRNAATAGVWRMSEIK